MQRKPLSSASLFSGAGGMDVGFARAGFRSVLACEADPHACATYNRNLGAVGHSGGPVTPGSVLDLDPGALPRDLDAIFGGPPCQGFSVAGRMDPADPRNRLLGRFFEIVAAARPRAFVCENVKNLAVSARWAGTRADVMTAAPGYAVIMRLLRASDHGVPQNRERVFFIGMREDAFAGGADELGEQIDLGLSLRRSPGPPVGEVLRALGPAGTERNPLTCAARITYARNPVLRGSGHAGMLFNGAGRPLDPRRPAPTLPASMGGNRTPIVDEDEVFGGAIPFVRLYHARLREGALPATGEVPGRLRRLTIREAAAIQTFPDDFRFAGPKSSAYRQIGNAVPCLLAEAVAGAVGDLLRTG